MNYLEAPDHILVTMHPRPWMFAAGGITGCRNWQKDYYNLLKDEPGTFINPRRTSWDIHASEQIYREQIMWEYQYLHSADIHSFWFSKETVQPISLFELGAMMRHSSSIVVGTDPEYPRRLDVVTQVGLYSGHAIEIADSLEVLAEQAKSWLRLLK